MKFSLREYVFLTVMWLARTIFDSNYGKEKTKYNINTYEEYKLAIEIVDAGLEYIQTTHLNIPGFEIREFVDFVILGHEISRYERLNKIRWYTSDDMYAIRSMRVSKLHNNQDITLLSELHVYLLMEFGKQSCKTSINIADIIHDKQK